MDKVKAAISDFTSKAGHNDTTVHETVAPGVQHEVVKPHQHEEVKTVVDKEVHQDHYHRTVQPVQDREVLPEQHKAHIGEVQTREFDHRDTEGMKRELAAEQGDFKDERVVEGTSHSQSAAPTVAGEHVHHHIHETIQPVVNKETIAPSVVHTTVPIHETHHNPAHHHQASTLPPVTMSDFKSRGGVLSGREERYDAFEGEPRNIGGAVAAGLKSQGEGENGHRAAPTEGVRGKDRDRATHGDFDPVDRGGERSGHEGGPVGGTSERSSDDKGDLRKESPQGKPSLKDKLNPKVDTDGDGKAGFMK